MASIKINENEMMALSGLPHLSIVLYMLGIRPRMDYSTGTVGVRPLISWQALRENIYVEPHPGIKHEYASMEAVRRAAVWLEKAGLIEMRSHDRQLIFWCPLADTDKHVLNKADRGPTDQAGRGPTGQEPHVCRVSAVPAPQARQIKTAQADGHPVTGKADVNISSSICTVVGLENRRAGEEEGSDFIFSKTMTSQQRAAIASKVAGMTKDQGQAVIDELTGCIQAGNVKNVAGLLRYFIEQVKAGNFMPDKGEAIRIGRETEKRTAAMLAAMEAQREADAAHFVKGAGKPANLAALVRWKN